jgi:hypothetical protein
LAALERLEVADEELLASVLCIEIARAREIADQLHAAALIHRSGSCMKLSDEGREFLRNRPDDATGDATAK